MTSSTLLYPVPTTNHHICQMFITKVVEISLLKILLELPAPVPYTADIARPSSCFAHEEYFCNLSLKLISHQQNRYVDS